MMLDRGGLRVQGGKGLPDDLCRKPVGRIGNAVLEGLRAVMSLKGLELLTHSHHVGDELTRQLSRKQLCKLLMDRPLTVFDRHLRTNSLDEA